MLLPIRRIRLEQGRPQFQVAAQAGIHASRLSLIETGRVSPKPEELLRLSVALGVPVDELVPAVGRAA